MQSEIFLFLPSPRWDDGVLAELCIDKITLVSLELQKYSASSAKWCQASYRHSVQQSLDGWAVSFFSL